MAQSQVVPAPCSSKASSSERQFNALALALFALQFEHNAVYRRLCLARATSPASVSRWTEIPAVPTSVFKEFDLTSLRPEERTAVFHSSGTTGQLPSRHSHSAESLALYEASLLQWFKAHVLADCCSDESDGRAGRRVDFLMLTPGSGDAPHSSLVHMFETTRRKFARGRSEFAGRIDADGGWSIDLGRAERALETSIHSGAPLLLMGTAFNFVHVLDHLAGQHQRLELPPGSRVLETGGYKGRSRSMSKTALHALISERLGIASERIICEYGMSELSSQAYDSEIAASRVTPHGSRMFRFPPWARARIVSPETGLEVAEGETGLVQVYDLANAWSVLAIQTEDLGVRRGNGFELLGRSTAAEPRGCSLMAV